MTNVSNLIKFSILLFFVFFMGNAYAWEGEDGSPDGKIYLVHVFSSFNTQFSDCFSFDKTGILIISDYGPLVYKKDQLNLQYSAWQAVATKEQAHAAGFVLSFHGSVAGQGHTITANGLNDDGDTFIFQGVQVTSCPLKSAAAIVSASPYKKP